MSKRSFSRFQRTGGRGSSILYRSASPRNAVTDTTRCRQASDSRQHHHQQRQQPMKKTASILGAPADVNLIPGARLVDDWQARGR